jgi:hypothetical protein
MTQPPLHLKLHSYLIQFDLGEIVNSKFLVEKILHNHRPLVDAHSSFQQLSKPNSRVCL